MHSRPAPQPPGVSCPFCGGNTLAASWVQKDLLGKPEVTMTRNGRSKTIADGPVRSTIVWTVEITCTPCGATGYVAPFAR